MNERSRDAIGLFCWVLFSVFLMKAGELWFRWQIGPGFESMFPSLAADHEGPSFVKQRFESMWVSFSTEWMMTPLTALVLALTVLAVVAWLGSSLWSETGNRPFKATLRALLQWRFWVVSIGATFLLVGFLVAALMAVAEPAALSWVLALGAGLSMGLIGWLALSSLDPGSGRFGSLRAVGPGKLASWMAAALVASLLTERLTGPFGLPVNLLLALGGCVLFVGGGRGMLLDWRRWIGLLGLHARVTVLLAPIGVIVFWAQMWQLRFLPTAAAVAAGLDQDLPASTIWAGNIIRMFESFWWIAAPFALVFWWVLIGNWWIAGRSREMEAQR